MVTLTSVIAAVVSIPLFGFAYSRFFWKRKTPLELPHRTMIILGSGGHTSEMKKLRSTLDEDIYSPRIYVAAHSDVFSVGWMSAIEESKENEDVVFETVYRVREVGQSWVTTIFLSLPISLIQSVYVYLKHRPHVVLTNGPGICVPFMLIAKLFKVLKMWECDIVYVESVCRVSTLSVSGRVAVVLADLVFVQWPELFKRYKRNHRVRYMGRLT